MGKTLFRSRALTRLFTSAFIALWLASAGAATVEDTLSQIRNLPPAQRKSVLEENARKEGEVVWYTSMSLTDLPKIVGLSKRPFPSSK